MFVSCRVISFVLIELISSDPFGKTTLPVDTYVVLIADATALAACTLFVETAVTCIELTNTFVANKTPVDKTSVCMLEKLAIPVSYTRIDPFDKVFIVRVLAFTVNELKGPVIVESVTMELA